MCVISLDFSTISDGFNLDSQLGNKKIKEDLFQQTLVWDAGSQREHLCTCGTEFSKREDEMAFFLWHACHSACFGVLLCVRVWGEWRCGGEQCREEALELISKVSSLRGSTFLKSFLGVRILLKFRISVFQRSPGSQCTQRRIRGGVLGNHPDC